MIADFKDLFTAYSTEGMTDSYLGLDPIVEEFELTGLVDELTELSQSINLYDELSVGDLIYSKVTESLTAMLSDHNIFLSEDATISEMITVADSLRLIKNWDEPSHILSILEQDDISDEEKFSELCALVSTMPAETFLAIIDSIGDGIMDRIKELYASGVSEEDQDESTATYVSTLKSLFAFFTSSTQIDPQSLRGFQLLKAGMRPGAPFKFYFDLVRQHFSDDSKDLAVKAANLFILLSMSEDTSGDINSAWQREGEYVFGSLETIQAVGVALKTIHGKYLGWTPIQRIA